MLTFHVTESDHCRSVYSFLRNLLPTAPTAYLHKLIRGRHLTVNGTEVTSDTLLTLGDTISLKESRRTLDLMVSSPPAVDILHEDDRILVINKPPGLPVHRTADPEPTLLEVAERFMAERGTAVKLRPVNRLDRGTSGAVILAKSATGAGMFGRLIKEKGFGKLYLAVADGNIPKEGTIDAPIDGKESQTHFRNLFQGEGAAILLVNPLTGRMHQIRRHLALTGHPVMGDRRYGSSVIPGYPGHCLHAFLLFYDHPVSGAQTTVHAPLPQGLIDQIRQLTNDSFSDILLSLASLSSQTPSTTS